MDDGLFVDGEQADNSRMNLSQTKKNWQLPPLDSHEVIRKLGKENRDISQYICNSLGKYPLCLKMSKTKVSTKGNMSNRQVRFHSQVASGSFEPKSWKKSEKMRSFWSFKVSERGVQQRPSSRRSSSQHDTLVKSYEEYISKLNPNIFELEVILPKSRACKVGNPVICYSIPITSGSVSETSSVSESQGVVTVFPNGKKKKGIEVGPTSLHLHSAPSLVDPHYARGKKFFWKGRNVGQV